MPYDSLREFLDKLDSQGEFKRVKKEVDWNLELIHIAKLCEAKEGPALLFENVKDYPGKSVVVDVLNTKKKIALALEVDPNSRLLDIAKHWLARINSKPIPPQWVDSAMNKQNVITGKNVNLDELPTPFFYPQDGGRYLGTAGCLVTKNPDTGRVNVGTYRGMLVDKNKMAQMFLPGRDALMDLRRYHEMGKPMPVACAIGVDPVLFLCAGSRFPPTTSEYDVAGALRGKPISVTKGETVDLPIPAEAEIVLEGEIAPDKKAPEGPYGEYTGFYSAKKSFPRDYIEVKVISYRNNPILQASTSGRPGAEGHIMTALANTAALWRELQATGIPGIKGVYFPPSAMTVVIIAIEQSYAAHATQVALAAFASVTGFRCHLKTTIMVDDDIDPEDLNQVVHALGMRCQPERVVQIPGRTEYPLLEPPIPPELRFTTSRMIIDACLPYEWPAKPERIILDEGLVQKIETRWDEYFTP